MEKRIALAKCLILVSLFLIACSNSNEGFSPNNSGEDSECVLNNETTMAKTFEKGNGTSSEPYVIASPEQFKYFAEQVKLGKNFESEYIRLETDLIIAETRWEPVGSRSRRFKGNFDGNGHTITGTLIAKPDADVFGFFGYVQFGSISNLNMSAKIDASNISSEFTTYIGSVVGRADADIINCKNFGQIVGPSRATKNISIGGLTGTLHKATMKDCVNEGDVVGGRIVESSRHYAAGLVAICEGTMINSHNKGKVVGATVESGSVETGGIAACAFEVASIDECTNSGMIIPGKSEDNNRVLTGLVVARTNDIKPSEGGHNVYDSCFNDDNNGLIVGSESQYLIQSCQALTKEDLKSR